MVIDPNSINNRTSGARNQQSVQRADNKTEAKPAEATGETASSDSVSLSSTGQSMSKLELAVAEVPEINASRVAEIRDALQSGQYKIDADAIAARLLNDGV
ncbi:flagellar biosynthesis anti-sigma factor FlgM [Agaribacterium haliotis]|uniref:flagellar biosynthesis anti-sigma factor FlgM n=1 Tax=Agaribacterium haliotis TaxID=2013869 RepID=UPI000BB59F28|nr:flagellar biosynthesis anti-sigma factor FlgM [Agaribacterium haliotis]